MEAVQDPLGPAYPLPAACAGRQGEQPTIRHHTNIWHGLAGSAAHTEGSHGHQGGKQTSFRLE